MQTPVIMYPNMVAAESKISGTAGAQSANPQAVDVELPTMPLWRPRAVRGSAFILWEDSLRDILPLLSLRHANLYEKPPARPVDAALSVESLL